MCAHVSSSIGSHRSASPDFSFCAVFVIFIFIFYVLPLPPGSGHPWLEYLTNSFSELDPGTVRRVFSPSWHDQVSF